MVICENFTLPNGVEVPKLGLGTWFIENDKAADAICEAVKIGYRHFDTAQAYKNENGVGTGICSCGISRNNIFVTTKLAAEIKDYGSAVKAIDGSLKNMGLDYIDMMLIHSPQPWADFRNGDYSMGNRKAWKALEEAHKAGKIRAIGVSNFKEEDIENILADCSVKPMVNQLLVHIGNTPFSLLEYCEKNNILVESYSPIAHGEMLKNQLVIDISKKYGVTASQLCIRYTIQLGTAALPKTSNPYHMKENADIDFIITNEDMELLKKAEHIKDYGEYTHFPVFSGK